jgi:hypothetical protein
LFTDILKPKSMEAAKVFIGKQALQQIQLDNIPVRITFFLPAFPLEPTVCK